jgi:sulfite reductase (NADPH) flavoprotein alpha-component
MKLTQQNNLLSPQQSKLINELLQKLNSEQKLWLGGYLTGLNESTQEFLNILNDAGKQVHIAPATVSDGPRLSILYGTRSGNAQKVAKMACSLAESKGVRVQLVNLNDYNPKDIKKESYVFVIVSTDGEGEPPITAEEFYHYIMGKKAPGLGHLRYSVLALGDSSYQHFCKIGRDIDARLLELGAKQLSPRVDCDVDFTDKSNEWATEGIRSFLETVPSGTVRVAEHQKGMANKVSYGKKNPYQATVLERINLNGRGSTKRTWHIELSLEESDITYQPGDALGVVCHNQEALVDEFFSVTGFNPESTVKTNSGEDSFRNSLIFNYELSTLTPQVAESYAMLVRNKDLIRLAEDKDELFKFTHSRDIVDLVREYPAKTDMDGFLAIMRKIQPRLYSIASSYQANPDEVHLTVGEVEYLFGRRKHQGTCSFMLSRLSDDKKVPVYIDENISFRLPEDPSVPIIMIGAGTGVAPYRAFLQERELVGSVGKNWLVFGERNFTVDFLYQTEWQKYLKNNVLTRMDVAFSRDQVSKIYVQDKLIENRKELFAWIEEGAHIYLCGDKNNMAHDVKQALQQIIAIEAGFTEEKATEYFRQLRKHNRFHEDVY